MLQVLPSRGGIYFLTLQIWAGLVTCSDQQNIAEVTLWILRLTLTFFWERRSFGRIRNHVKETKMPRLPSFGGPGEVGQTDGTNFAVSSFKLPRGKNGNPLCILTWKIPCTEEPGRLQSVGSQRIKHDWACSQASTHTHTHMHAFNLGTVSQNPFSIWFQVCCSVAQLCLTLGDHMDCSTPGFPSPSQWCHLTISSSVSPFSSCPQHQGLFQWVSSSHQVAEVLELQLQHQSFQWIIRVDFL